ncbi:uncharacterized protein HLK63_K12177 [Nakaseomyces glabratus]|nr:uncharacterized protein GW608_K12177 [Nakaseomyces glabratus]UCS27795.1 uncharacterized protein HLK63_K12177 [Nakaseomyces glabratus]UCS33024.1 uncharacterized protein HLK64_K12177 [Nakaseomyces glabratus]UCS38253.1 uncharacterized protein HLK62_K12177 [Nakaseomyces glabratus]
MHTGYRDQLGLSHFDILSGSEILGSHLENHVREKGKIELLDNTISKKDIDVLRALGYTEFGYARHNLRRKAWHIILRSQYVAEHNDKIQSTAKTVTHKDEKQIELDVNRSFNNLKNGSQRAYLRKVLQKLLIRFFRSNSELSYYQGFHDVISVFILVFLNYDDDNTGEHVIYKVENIESLFYCVEAFSLLYLRDFLMPTLDFSIDQLKVIQNYILNKDEELYEKMQLDVIHPLYAISSVLTVFAHELKPTVDDQSHEIFEVFDMIISSQSMFLPLNIYATLFLQFKSDIITTYEVNIENFENEADLIHCVIQQVIQKNLYSHEIHNESFINAIKKVRLAKASEYTLTNVSDMVNVYSPLVTTARGESQLFTSEEINEIVGKQLIYHNKQQQLKIQAKERLLKPKSKHINSMLSIIGGHGSISPLIKASIAVAIVAILLRMNKNKRIIAGISTGKEFIGEIKHLHSSIFYSLKNSYWKDPLKIVLHTYKKLQNQLSSSDFER